MNSTTLAKLFVAYSGVAWGLFWLPLHRLEQVGLTPLWAVIVFNVIPSLLILPVAIVRWRSLAAGSWLPFAAGIAMATTQIFYSLALLNTEVVRAITLFYLNPVWTAVLARVLLGERLGATGLFAMLLAFVGMALVLQTGFNMPLPETAGDWYAIAAGLAWAVSVIVLRVQPETDPVNLTIHALLWIGLGLVPLMFWAGIDTFPAWNTAVGELWWLLPFVILVLMTGVFTSMWGVPKLSPNLVTLLYMTEISTAAITAALLSDEEFTLLDGIGVTLIALGGALTSIWQLLLSPKAALAASREGD